MWITILLQLMPIILEMIKKWLERERQAAVAGHEGPAMVYVKEAQAVLMTESTITTASLWKAHAAGSTAFSAAEARMGPPA